MSSKRRVIALSGFIGSGKDAAAQYLIDRHRFVKESFASTLKDSLAAIFGWSRELLEGSTVQSREWREQVDLWWSDRLGIENFSPRKAMQTIGTDLFRSKFHDDIWVAALERRLASTTKNVVITDCRFINELNAIRRAGGITVRVSRGQDPEWLSLAKTNMQEFHKHYPDVHSSEYTSVNYDYDWYIDNNSDFENLYGQMRELLVRG